MRPGTRRDGSAGWESSGLGGVGDGVWMVVVAGVVVIAGVMKPLTRGWLEAEVEVEGRGGNKSKRGAERSRHGA